MTADRQWVERNLGFDPITAPPPSTTFAFGKAAFRTPESIQREIIEFDSESPAGREFLAFSTATGLSRFTDVPWPSGLAPITGAKPKRKPNQALPTADVLIVTWTVDEGHALSRVLTPGKDSRDDYLPYTHNFATIARKMRKGCPALKAKRLGAYWTCKINGKSVVVFKSESHMSQDGPKLPNANLWSQIVTEVKPKLVITTGTAGGIGSDCEVGDVLVSAVVRFDCTAKFKSLPFGKDNYSSQKAKTAHFATAESLFAANAKQLPKDNKRAPKIFVAAPQELAASVVTTDFFGIDTTDNHFNLKGLGRACEMGDAILGKIAKDMGGAAPRWLAIRNVSDPEIKSDGLTTKQQIEIAAQIYKGFGRWSTVCSAIACWAAIVAEA